MRKYFTVDVGKPMVERACKMFRSIACDQLMKLTIVDLLQCNDRVGGQALLRILIQQEGLRSDWALLRWQHGGVVRGGIHGRHCSKMMRAARRGPSSCGGK
jgi:hypothetical protein